MPESQKIGLNLLSHTLIEAARESLESDGTTLSRFGGDYIRGQVFRIANRVSKMGQNPGEPRYDGHNLSKLHLSLILAAFKETINPKSNGQAEESVSPWIAFREGEAKAKATELRRLGVTEKILDTIPERLKATVPQTSEKSKKSKGNSHLRMGTVSNKTAQQMSFFKADFSDHSPQTSFLMDDGVGELQLRTKYLPQSTSPVPSPITPTAASDACKTYSIDGLTLTVGTPAPPAWLRLAILETNSNHKDQPWTLTEIAKALDDVVQAKRTAAGQAKDLRDTPGQHDFLTQADQIVTYAKLLGVSLSNGQQ